MTIPTHASPLLVLLPGMDGTARLFHRFDAALRAQAAIDTQAIAYPAAPLDYAALEAFVRERLPRDRPFVVLAESFSGPLGAALRAEPPPGMRALVLCCSFVRNPRPMLAPLRHLLGLVPFGAMPGFALRQALLAPCSTPQLQLQLQDELAAALAQVPPSVLRQRLRAVLETDASRSFARGSLPVLYLRARHDRLVPPANAVQILRLAPDAQLADIAAPHMLLQAAPEAAAVAVTAFLAGLSAAQVSA
ncbi:alpha/beta hydrolase [Janthinobacterium sp. PLB04]|uniref:Alpha/beta hydrolase n=1 Tax=Janthinobacterium lividum TaxID=29581 RepID=A0AAJ4MWJ9_9BURK|nr:MULTISPECIES: alpha/beta hydrolase [Janthinobacterium]KAB0332125.1 alpha/beta hydrolase [Janthinobacterium lividum]QSX98318.1 alpha/beta hydrolase [Janthinobacterium lividum]UGQ38308.1 alpha/beta hydrolase [Janthinobacterium sp. PLB04]